MAGAIPQTGLTMLGQSLLQASGDYANRRMSQQDEARRRSERLQDVDSQRQYEQQNFDKMRNLQLSDEQRRRVQGVDDLKTKAALEARFKMLNEATARGLIDAATIGNQVAEDEAIKAVAELLANEAKFDAGQRPNAQAKLAELGQAEQAITQKMAALEAKLSSQPTIDQQALQATAVQIATQMNGGKMPSREQITAAMADAQAQAKERALMEWYQQKSDAQVQYQILSSQLNTIRQQQANLSSTFKVAPGASPLVQEPAATAPVVAPAGGNPLGGFLETLNKTNPPPPPASNLALAEVGAATRAAPAATVPLLKQAGTAMLADAYQKFDDPVNQINSQIADVDEQIASASAGSRPPSFLTPLQYDIPGGNQFSPAEQGKYLTSLLQKKASLEQQRQKAQQERQAGKSSALSSLQINTPTQSVPVFKPSPGAVLSDPYSGM